MALEDRLVALEDLKKETDGLKRLNGRGQWTLELNGSPGQYEIGSRIKLGNGTRLRVTGYHNGIYHLLYEKYDIRLVWEHKGLKVYGAGD